MRVRDLINRAYMQVGDTSQETYTPYQFLEFYNEGNQLLNTLMGKYCPSLGVTTYEDRGIGQIFLPNQCVAIRKVTADGQEVSGYHVLNLQTVKFKADKEQAISVDYVPSAEYKKFDDNSNYPAELETLLVDYMVARIMNIDVSGITGSMTEILRSLNNSSDSESGYVLSKGYWDYDSTRIDYTD